MPIALTDKQEELRRLLSGDAKHALLFGGSRSGKTFICCVAIASRAIQADGSRHAIFRKHGVAVKQSIGQDTFPKVLALMGGHAQWRDQDGLFVFPNGSEVWLAGLDDKERVDKVLGKEYATLYFNEASEIPYQSYLVAQTRLAQKVASTFGRGAGDLLPLKSYVDLNPTTQSHWTYKLFVQGIEPESKRPIDRENYVYGVANPRDNAENLPADYIASLQFLPDAQKRRFFDGQFAGDSSDALWSRSVIDNMRLYVRNESELPPLRRIVVAIDPAISSDTGSNETGIVAAGIDAGGQGYVLADGSGVFKPDEWARAALSLYRHYSADRIVAEANQGGEMVEQVIRSVNPDAPVKLVKASRGKYVRAEPVAALYARGRVKHVGEFSELEDQMCTFTSDFDRKAEGYSPDRLDALVWAMTELFPNLVSDRGRKSWEGQAVAHGDYDVFQAEETSRRMNQQAIAGMDYQPF